MDSWLKVLFEVSDLLREHSVDHVFMKMLVDPFSPGKDVDVLIPDEADREHTARLLLRDGFKAFDAGRVSPPGKVVFIRDGQIVEIYPEASWKREQVADSNRIVSDKILNENLGVYMPCEEDEFYLISTHAFSHMRITEAEAKNAVRLTQNNFNWMRVRDTTTLFGTHISIYFFLKTLNGLEPPEMFSNSVDRIGCRLIDGWFEHERNVAFPIKVPRIFGRILTPLHHTPALIRNGVGVKEVLYDFISNLC